MADIQRRRDVKKDKVASKGKVRMKKKYYGVMICFISMLCFVIGMGKEREAFSSVANSEMHFRWEINAEGTVRIIGLYGENAITKVVIPEEIDGKKVTEIGSDVFIGCIKLERVEIPNTVKTIGEQAFSGGACLNYISVAEGYMISKRGKSARISFRTMILSLGFRYRFRCGEQIGLPIGW